MKEEIFTDFWFNLIEKDSLVSPYHEYWETRYGFIKIFYN